MDPTAAAPVPAVLRVATCSGSYGDRASALKEVLHDGAVDVVTDDYLAELTMLIRHRSRLTLLPETESLAVQVHPLADLRSVDVVVAGLLGEGVASSTRFQPQAKELGEYLRSRRVDVPGRLRG